MTTHSKKQKVLVLYGGRSGEHEVSLRSAASVIQYLDKNRFDIVPIAIDKKGKWYLQDLKLIESAGASLPVIQNEPAILLPPYPNVVENRLCFFDQSGKTLAVDVIFPVMHGTFCEDGTLQGLFELAEIPYVGCGVLSSAIGMDKEVSKRLARDAGLPIVPYISLKRQAWDRNENEYSLRIAKELGYPVFVKPANSGSSVGVYKVKEAKSLQMAILEAFKFDTKVLVEKSIQAREIEFAVLENSTTGLPPLVSLPGEVSPTHEFYSYEAKYLDESEAKLFIPSALDSNLTAMGQKIAREAFEVLECEGMARVDLFLDKTTGAFYFNEVNTLPGFTSISMYPKMWEASGMPYSVLLSHLIDLAVQRAERKRHLVRDLQFS